jgi:DNA-binding beta-propeller fold protein YncE
MTRRSFVTAGGCAAAGVIAGFPNLRASDKTGHRKPVVGAGEHQYECIHDWGRLPAGMAYGNTHGVAVDSQGLIYIKHTVHETSRIQDAIVVFDPDGKSVRSWGAEFRGGAHGLTLAREGGQEYLYLCDTLRHLLVKTTLKGEVVWERGCPPETGGYKKPDEYVPTNVAVAPDGIVFVADGYGRNYIHRFRSDGSYISTFGGTGENPGHLRVPHGLIVDTRKTKPVLLVADRTNRRLQYFTLEGEHLGFVTEELRSPCHFDIRGDVLLIPDLRSRVTLFDRNDKLLAHLGDGTSFVGIRDKDRTAFTPGQFVAPHGAAFDADGNIFVAEWVVVGRVTKLRKLA